MRLNDDIRGLSEVRLIGEDGEMVGLVPFDRALAIARESDLDLCEISPTAKPPVCRVMDYGKYMYQQKKKEHDNQRKHQAHEQKQIRIKSFRIDPHDLRIKVDQSRKFIETGHRVLYTLMFRARENDHPELGHAVLHDEIFKPLEDVAVLVSPPKKEGRRMTMVLAPVANIEKVVARRKAEAEKAAKDAENAAALDNEDETDSVAAENAEEDVSSDVEVEEEVS